MRYYLAVVVLALSGWAHAHPVSQPDAARLFGVSDIVCSGTVIATKGTRPPEETVNRQTLRYMVATVVVRDLYKGNLPKDQPILIEFSGAMPLWDNPASWVEPGENALLFLKRKDGGTFAFADHQLGAIRFTSVPVETEADGLSRFEAAMASILVSGNAHELEDAALLLLTLDRVSPVTISKIIPAAASLEQERALYVIAVLIKCDTPQGLEQLKRYLAQNRKHEDQATAVQVEAMVAIMGELASVSDAHYLKDVEDLSFADDLGIRTGTIQAMRNMNTKAAAPTLVKHLDDPDNNIRYSALMALAMLFDKRGEYVPGWPEFNQKPDYYAALWKAWAQQAGIGPTE